MNNQNYLRAEKFFEVPVMISVLMLIPVLIIEYSQQTLSYVALNLNWGIWIVFLLEYVTLYYFADDKLKFVKSHKIELVIIYSHFNCSRGFTIFWIFKVCKTPKITERIKIFQACCFTGKIWNDS
jgi:hypothetical protein